MMESKTFQAIAILIQFLLSIAMFWWAIKTLILPRRRNRKGKAVNYHFRLPNGYRSLPTEGKYLDGNFTNKTNTSSIVAVSKNFHLNYENRKNEILNPKNEKITNFISEGSGSINGQKYSWLKTISKNKEMTISMISYFFFGTNYFIEIGCGSKVEEFQICLKDFNELITSVTIKES